MTNGLVQYMTVEESARNNGLRSLLVLLVVTFCYLTFYTDSEILFPQLHIRWDFEYNCKIDFFLFLNKNTYCDISLEQFGKDRSNEESQHMFDGDNRNSSLSLVAESLKE